MRDTPEHEAKCQRCGVSCHAGVVLSDGRQIVVEGLHCMHLGPGNTCAVYANRFKAAPWCHHVKLAGPKNMLRHDCPYTPEGNPMGKRRLTEADYAGAIPEVIEALLSKVSVVPHFSYKAFFLEMRRRDPEHVWSLKTHAVGTSSKLYRKKKSWLARMFS